jgi:enoyl-CoA hydratase/carnithine racemase
MRFVLTAEEFDAAETLRIRLVQEIVRRPAAGPDGDDRPRRPRPGAA